MIIGASGHGKVVADIAKKMGIYEEISFLDDDLKKRISGYKLMGAVEEYRKWIATHDFIIAIGDSKIRSRIQKMIEKEAVIAILVHPNAVIGEKVQMGKGTVIMANVVVNSDTVLGEGVILNTGSTIDHDCHIGDYVHVAPGCHISGTVSVGHRAWIGVGSCIVNNVNICEECVVGAGAAVIADIKEKGTYVGVPARKVTHGSKNT